MTKEEKFEMMDEIVKNYDSMSTNDRYEIFSKELDRFYELDEADKADEYYDLFVKAVLNKRLCIEKSKIQLDAYSEMLAIIKRVTTTGDTDMIMKSIASMESMIKEDYEKVEEEMRYCKK